MSSQKEINRDYFAAALKDQIVKSGIKQGEIAEKTGILQGRISEIVNGKYTAGVRVQTKIAQCFGYDLTDFLEIGCRITDARGQKEIATQAPPIVHLDRDLMTDVITTLEEFLTEQKKRLDPEAKAEIIIQLYELMKEEEAKASPPAARFKQVAPVLSKALSMAKD